MLTFERVHVEETRMVEDFDSWESLEIAYFISTRNSGSQDRCRSLRILHVTEAYTPRVELLTMVVKDVAAGLSYPPYTRRFEYVCPPTIDTNMHTAALWWRRQNWTKNFVNPVVVSMR